MRDESQLDPRCGCVVIRCALVMHFHRCACDVSVLVSCWTPGSAVVCFIVQCWVYNGVHVMCYEGREPARPQVRLRGASL
jgi:hypothetical protein